MSSEPSMELNIVKMESLVCILNLSEVGILGFNMLFGKHDIQ
jgi:hypothetical protein